MNKQHAVSMKALLVLSLFLIVLVSGCVGFGGGGVAYGTGVVIESFETDFPEVYSTENVNFNLKVRNTGSVSAEDVEARIVGLEEWKGNRACGTVDEIIAPNPIYGTQGGTRTCLITLTAPEIPQGLSLTYYPTARVTYRYSTETVKIITIYPTQELKRLQDQGKALPIETESSTSGPISLDIQTKSPIRSFERSITFPITVNIENVGGGVVCLTNECHDSETWNRVWVKIDPKDMDITECSSGWIDVTLWKGKSNTITCKLRAKSLLTSVSSKKTLKVIASYSYFFDKSIPITVIPKLDSKKSPPGIQV